MNAEQKMQILIDRIVINLFAGMIAAQSKQMHDTKTLGDHKLAAGLAFDKAEAMLAESKNRGCAIDVQAIEAMR